MSPKNTVEIRSEEVEEILGKAPGWLIRWGITAIFITVAVILIGSWFFKYPDVINAPITITTENIPAVLVARSNGKISELLIKDKQKVKSGQLLAVIENPASTKDVMLLKNLMDSVTFSARSNDATLLATPLMLGDLQPEYAALTTAMKNLEHFEKEKFHELKIQSLRKQMSKYEHLQNQLSQQSELMKQQLQLTEKQYQRDSLLYSSGTIAASEWEKSKTQLLQQKYACESAKASLINNAITITQLEQNILDLEKQYYDQQHQLQIQASAACENLKSSIKKWEQTYLLVAPIDGVVSFTKFWSANQNVVMGDKVLTIIPEKETAIIGRISLAMQGSGKIKTGQTVNIQFANFPYMEYGLVKGKISNLSLMPTDNILMAEVQFPEGLTTNYKKTLPFSQEMQGNAEIITEDTRLLQRFINPIKALLKKKTE